MYRGNLLSVVIPTLNEACGIQRTLNRIPESVDEVIVVDGNSTDGTASLAEQWGAKVVLEPRLGYGRAFQSGFAHAVGDIIATADGDSTYPIERLESIVDYLLDNKVHFLSCSRLPLQEPSSMSTLNHVGNYLLTKAASLLWIHSFADILSGMWVFRRECLSTLSLYDNGWNFSEEIKLEAFMQLGVGFAEYSIPYRTRLGSTKLSPWSVGVANLLYMIKMRARSVSSASFRPRKAEVTA
jgi:glycosyltransferase involved in cell wall biosynthesis